MDYIFIEPNSGLELRPPRKKRARKEKHAPPLYSASIVERADRVFASTAGVSGPILSRIKKCLTRAHNAGASEAEAKAALHLACKEMRRFNISQAEVLAHEEPEERVKHAGQSIVALSRRDGDSSIAVRENSYLVMLSDALECFFDCKSYTSNGWTAFETTFYGIAENTVAAAEAYCMVYNLMVEWACPYNGLQGKRSYCEGLCTRLRETAEEEKREEEVRAKEREQADFEARIRQEEAERERQLRLLDDLPERGSQSAQVEDQTTQDDLVREDSPPVVLATSVEDEADTSDDGVEYEEWNGFSDEDDDGDVEHDSGFDMQADFDDDAADDYAGFGDSAEEDVDTAIHDIVTAMNRRVHPFPPHEEGNSRADRHISPGYNHGDINENDSQQLAGDGGQSDVPALATGDPVDPTASTNQETWPSQKQLMHYRVTANDTADSFQKDKNIKLFAKKKHKLGHLDLRAYKDGVKDGKKIDVRRKNIAERREHERP